MVRRNNNLGRLREYKHEKTDSDKLLSTPGWQRILRTMLPVTDPKQCHLCLCNRFTAPSDSLDHVIPRTEKPELTFTMSNLRPVHHKACPSCGQRCNLIRGWGTIERAQRIIAERKAKAGVLEVHKTEESEGREWD